MDNRTTYRLKCVLASAWDGLRRVTRPFRRKHFEAYRELIELIDLYSSLDRAAEVLLLGDSVVERISRYDGDQRTLDRILGELFTGQLRVGCISHTAYNLRIFEALLRALGQLPARPKLIILPINLRSFSPQWFHNPVWQLTHEMDSIEQFIAKGGKNPMLERESRSTYSLGWYFVPVKYPASDFTRLGQFLEVIYAKPKRAKPKNEAARLQRKKQIFIFHYLHPLSPTHPLLGNLKRVIELSANLRVALLAYFTPLNYQAGQKIVGEAFLETVNANLALVQEVFASAAGKETKRLVDFSQLLSVEHFFHEEEASEHLNQEGRRILAEAIAGEIRNLLGEQDEGFRRDTPAPSTAG